MQQLVHLQQPVAAQPQDRPAIDRRSAAARAARAADPAKRSPTSTPNLFWKYGSVHVAQLHLQNQFADHALFLGGVSAR